MHKRTNKQAATVNGKQSEGRNNPPTDLTYGRPHTHLNAQAERASRNLDSLPPFYLPSFPNISPPVSPTPYPNIYTSRYTYTNMDITGSGTDTLLTLL